MRLSSKFTAMLICFVALGHALGCANIAIPNQDAYAYFGPPPADDAWTPKIAGWQRREYADDGRQRPDVAADADFEPFDPMPPKEEALPPEATLRNKYFAFRAERKRAMARELAAWVQGQARDHYVPDGPSDHWATFEETLRSDGDDCDGLELLAYHGLRDLGFAETEVYRAIVFRKNDGQHHMVTLWFEDPQDPWVIDPTGAMTTGMPHMSDMPGWVPLKVFSETVEYTVQPVPPSAASLAAN